MSKEREEPVSVFAALRTASKFGRPFENSAKDAEVKSTAAPVPVPPSCIYSREEMEKVRSRVNGRYYMLPIGNEDLYRIPDEIQGSFSPDKHIYLKELKPSVEKVFSVRDPYFLLVQLLSCPGAWSEISQNGSDQLKKETDQIIKTVITLIMQRALGDLIERRPKLSFKKSLEKNPRRSRRNGFKNMNETNLDAAKSKSNSTESAEKKEGRETGRSENHLTEKSLDSRSPESTDSVQEHTEQVRETVQPSSLKDLRSDTPIEERCYLA